jgi:hypothetical protein
MTKSQPRIKALRRCCTFVVNTICLGMATTWRRCEQTNWTDGVADIRYMTLPKRTVIQGQLRRPDRTLLRVRMPRYMDILVVKLLIPRTRLDTDTLRYPGDGVVYLTLHPS